MKASFYRSLKQNIWILLIPVSFCVILFSPAIFTDKTLFHMDWAPYFPRSNWIGPWQHFVVSHSAFSLMHIMKAFLPLRFYHVAFYIVAISGTTLSLYAYLRDRGLEKGSALFGGIAFGFSGYCVSLVSAGHRGVFEACLSAALLLFVGSRAIRRGTWHYWLLSALSIALVLGTQPDVFLILLMGVGPLLLVDLIYQLRMRQDGHVKKISIGILVFAISMTLFGWRGVEKILTKYLPGRQSMIEQSGTGPAVQADGKKQKWIFCTNWSLPPSDCVELAVPLVLGVESTDRELPLWGALGRSYEWEPGKPGFPSYRQHTVYAGGIQLVFGFYTLFLLFRRPKVFDPPNHTLLAVCAGLIAITFMLALGRYFPLYRFFYALPLADSIRCPVKFLHAVNLAGAVLGAFGLQVLSKRFKEGLPKKNWLSLLREPEGLTLAGIILVLAALLISLIVIGTGMVSFKGTWSSLGFDAGVQKALLDLMNKSLVHAALVFGFAGILFFLALRDRSASWSVWVPWACALAVAVDMTVVNSRYVNTQDLSVQEMNNMMVEDMLKATDHKPRVLDLITGWNPHHPIRANLTGYYSQDIVMVGKEQRNNPEFFAAFRQGGPAMKKALSDYNVEYVIAPVKLAGALESSGIGRVIDYYGFDGHKFVRVPSGNSSVAICKIQ